MPQQRAPSLERAAPRAPVIDRADRRQQRIQQHTRQRQQLQQPAAAERRPLRQNDAAENVQQNAERLKELQQRRKLNRAERREFRELKRTDQDNKRQQQAIEANPDRLKELQEQRRRGRLSRDERRELRELRRTERDQGQKQQQQDRLSRDDQRELRERGRTEGQLRRTERQQPGSPAADRASDARFASKFHDRKERREARRAARLAAKVAWRLGLLAHHVPWHGAVYWPYAYHDIFYYTFWPTAYEPGYWAFVYDDFFDGVFFPYGAPAIDYPYAGPYGPLTRGTTGAAPTSRTPANRSTVRASRDACAEQARMITAWPFTQIERAVRPDSGQKELLAELKQVSEEAAERFKDACPENLPMTPPGRLQAMVMRLQATLDAVKTVRPALEAFYGSLSDEQKARFNEIGPEIAERRRAAAEPNSQAECGGEMAGLSDVPIERIEEVVQPTDAQLDALDRLDEALTKAVEILSEACPTTVAETPVGRLEMMEKRLEAMISAANAVRPALDDFYAVLSNEQKAKFNRLGRENARAGR
jgi:hypothetical protein